MNYRLIIGYSLGHILNDLCASIWFTYTLVYFIHGMEFSDVNAGILMLVGQIFDAVSTPLVGIISDRISSKRRTGDENSTGIVYYLKTIWPGNRKGFHLLGSVLVIVAFPLLYTPFYFKNRLLLLIFYCALAAVFQMGWASIQISHLALLNDLVKDSDLRSTLVSGRYIGYVLANMTVFGLFYIIFQTEKPSTLLLTVHRTQLDTASSVDFGPSDVKCFSYLAYILTGLGLVTTICFHLLVKEDTSNRDSDGNQGLIENIATDEEIASTSYPVEKNNLDWLKDATFWLLGLVYMTIRLTVNMSQLYINMYLLVSLKLSNSAISLVPLTIYLSSIVSTIVQNRLQKLLPRDINCLIGTLFIFIFSTTILFLDIQSPFKVPVVYIVSLVLGLGASTLLVTSISMISDLVGNGNTATGAFVFGAMSFADKLSSGLTIQLIQIVKPYVTETLPFGCEIFYKGLESYGIAGCNMVCIVFLIIYSFTLNKKKRK